jgi:CreA protein
MVWWRLQPTDGMVVRSHWKRASIEPEERKGRDYCFRIIVIGFVPEIVTATTQLNLSTKAYRMIRTTSLFCLLAVIAVPASAEEVGKIGTDWTGNDIVVEAISDPEVQGVTCHMTYFSRGLIDRLRKGDWFQDPSNSSIACRQTGPITIGEIETDKNGDEIFSERQSLIFKSLAVRRIYDKTNNTLVYVSFSRQVQEGSAKMAVSTIPLFDEKVTWSHGKPQ